MRSVQAYQELFSTHLQSMAFAKEPLGFMPNFLYPEIRGQANATCIGAYGLRSCGKSPSSALGAATAVELFHNFTLLHDDIMDEASLRRGQQTVHQNGMSTLVFFRRCASCDCLSTAQPV